MFFSLKGRFKMSVMRSAAFKNLRAFVAVLSSLESADHFEFVTNLVHHVFRAEK